MRDFVRSCDQDRVPIVISEPMVLLYPRPGQQTFRSEGVDIISALVDFGVGMLDSLASALPNYLAVPLSAIPELATTIDLLFVEAFNHREGRQIAVDGLMEYFLVLLRSALNLDLIHDGILKTVSDSNLAKAVTAIHEEPERAWILEDLGHIAGMSRA